MAQTIVKLAPGKQVPPVFTGKSNITYVANGGIVEFTSQLLFGNTNQIYFDGADANSSFKYSGTDRQVLNPGNGNNIDTRFLVTLDCGSGADMVINAVDKILPLGDWVTILAYDGTPKTAVWFGIYFENLIASGKTRPVYGTYEPASSYRMILVNVSIKNYSCAVGDDNAPIKVSGNSIYGFRAGYDLQGNPTGKWTVKGPTKQSGGDSGIIYITTGNAKVNNLWSDTIPGYLIRIWVAKLGGSAMAGIDQESGMYNCVKVRGTLYGMVDCRIDGSFLASNAAMPITGGNFEVVHCDSGDNMHDSGYIANAVIIGTFIDDLGKKWTLTVRDSFAWNAYNNPNGMAAGSSLLKDNSGGSTVPILKNNIDLPPGVPLPAGYLVDKIACVPVSPGPLIAKASDGKDIGAVQSVVTPPIPPQPPKPRTVVKAVFTYDDGSTSSLP